MSATAETPATDIYRYGWRDISTRMPDGTRRFTQMPLTLKDCLHPQEGDHIVNSSDHNDIIDYLKMVLRTSLYKDAMVLVSDDLGVYWDDPRYDHHSPDLAVFFGVRDRDRFWPSFNVAEEGVKPTVIIEVVSTNVRTNDVDEKVEHYHDLEIPFYLIVDHESEDSPRTLIGYQYTPLEYVPMPRDKQGRVWIAPLNIWVEAKERSVVCYDGVTNERFPGLNEMPLRMEREAAMAAKERDRAEQEKTRADAEKVKAEQERERADSLELRLRELEAKLRDKEQS